MKVEYLKKLIFMVAFTFICTLIAHAQWQAAYAFTVTKTGDANDGICDGDCSLREAIQEANALGGTIILPAGTYNLSLGALSIAPISGNITIIGDGATNTFIDGGGLDRVFHVTSGSDNGINGVTIRNGLAGEGGGILNASTLTITKCTISGNNATSGGGIKNNNGNMLTIDKCTFSGNNAIGNGGGIKDIGTMVIGRSTFSGNTATSGAGIHISSPSSPGATIDKCTFSGNTATGDGGGIHISSPSSPNVSFTNSTISDNTALIGGGIHISSPSSPNVSFTNSIIAGNMLQPTGASPDCSGTIISLGNNLIGDTTGCTIISGGTGDRTGVAPTPLDPRLSDFISRRTPGWGHYQPEVIYNQDRTAIIAPISEAIDNGADVSVDDQLGRHRPSDSTALTVDAQSDIGAIEYQPIVNAAVSSLVVESEFVKGITGGGFGGKLKGIWKITVTYKNIFPGVRIRKPYIEVVRSYHIKKNDPSHTERTANALLNQDDPIIREFVLNDPNDPNDDPYNIIRQTLTPTIGDFSINQNDDDIMDPGDEFTITAEVGIEKPGVHGFWVDFRGAIDEP